MLMCQYVNHIKTNFQPFFLRSGYCEEQRLCSFINLAFKVIVDEKGRGTMKTDQQQQQQQQQLQQTQLHTIKKDRKRCARSHSSVSVEK